MKFGHYISIFLALTVSAIAGHARGGIVDGDPVFEWLDHPDQRSPEVHLAFVEVLSITNEQYTFDDSESHGKVSDDGGKTWYSLTKVRSGMATVRVIESPGASMPATITVFFQRGHYVHSRDDGWTESFGNPGARLIGFFSQKDGKWATWRIIGFIDPVDYLLIPRYGSRLQALFHTPLSDDKTVADRKRLYDEAAKRAQQQAATNHVDEK